MTVVVTLLHVGLGGSHAPEDALASTPPDASTLTLSWVGDITPGSAYGLPPDNGGQMFLAVKDLIGSADLAIGNLEGTLSAGGTSKCADPAGSSCFAFQAPVENAAALADAGFDLMNLANNHALDFGSSGQAQTIQALDAAHIAHAGLPGSITHRDVNGLRVAVIGFAPYPWATSLHDIAAAQQLVTAAAQDADVVVVLMHAGAEGADQTHTPVGVEVAYGEDRGDTRGFAHAVIDAGADVVLGSGPHVVRGVERYRDRLIAYSLGNFAGYDNFATGGALSLSGLLEMRLAADGRFVDGRWHSLVLDDHGQPSPDPSGLSAQLVDHLSREDFPAAFVMDGTGRMHS
ncbi:MAG: CapA family protein [Solirubrobacteraceae bacterium]